MQKECSKNLITAAVREAVDKVLASGSDEPGGEALRRMEVNAPALFALSPYLLNTAVRYPLEFIESMDEKVLRAAPPSLQAIRTAIVEAAMSDSEEAQMRALRRARHVQMMRILLRDLLGVASVDETLFELSELADACIQCAVAWSEEAMHVRFGLARDESGREQRLITLGMGKLGGHELNVSSDIDLIYIFASAGSSDGKKSLDNADYFRRVAQRTSRMLGAVTEDGFVYRVDTRLRPFGDSGPLVMNLNALEHYYLTQGRDWERYAMVKARAITGDTSDIDELYELLQPFIYRRYLDYSAIDSLRELKRKIALSVVQRDKQKNIKLGRGGIREIEFIGQAFQLVRGGREPRLQLRSIKKVFSTLVELQLMDSKISLALVNAYDFLRRVENALQAMRDQQVHSLPSDKDDQLRLIGMLNITDWQSFCSTLNAHQTVVAEQFDALFADPQTTDESENPLEVASEEALRAWAIVNSMDADDEAAGDALGSLGIAVNEELLGNIVGLCKGAFYARLTARGQDRLDHILPRVFDAVLQYDDPATSLLRCSQLLRAVAGRSGYVQILIERPHALERLVRLFSHSAWAAQFVSRHPIVIDEFLRYDRSMAMPELSDVCNEAMAEARRMIDWELDEQMDGMRHFKQARELRIAVAELDDHIPLMRVSDQLSWLAQAMLHAVLFLVEHRLQQRHGKPGCMENGQARTPDVCLVGYGKLGGLELGYGSDLDVVFLHDSAGEKQSTGGEKPIDNSQYFARLAQKAVHFMNTQTPAGLLYEMDLRLRPNGQSGVLVTSFDSFSHYQQSDAWTWEHQALVRARVVVAPEHLATRFDEIRLSILSTAREPVALRDEVVNMRHRMRESLDQTNLELMHLKQATGGIADIEFIVQYLVLANALQHPTLCEFTDNIRILERAVELGLLMPDAAQTLIECYLSLRGLQHRQALQLQSATVKDNAKLQAIRQRVEQHWQQIMLP